MEKTRATGFMKYVLAAAIVISVLLTMRMFAHATGPAGEGGTVEVNTTDVNVRVSADAGSQKVGQVTTGDKFTVLGSTTGADGKLWYNISGTIGGQETTGYIRSDFVNVIDAGSGAPAESSEGGDEPAQEPEPAAESGGEDVTSSISSTNYTATALEPETEPPVIPEGFTEIKLKVAGAEDIRGWSNNTFTIFYGSDPSGYTGWFLYENATYRYVRYTDFLVNLSSGGEEGKAKGGNGLNIFLLVLCVILAGVCVFMGIKLFGNRDDYEYEDDDDDEDDGDFRPSRRGGERPQRGSEAGARPVRPGATGAAPGSRTVSARSAEGGARPQRGGEEGGRPTRPSRPAEGGARPQRAPEGARPVRQARPEGGRPAAGAPTRRAGGAQQVRQSRPVDDYDDED